MTLALIGALAGCIGSSAAADPAPGRPLRSTRAPRFTTASLEREVFDLVNSHRTSRGLPTLTFDARIAHAARRHSSAMAARSAPIGHQGFDDRIAALRRVMPFKRSAENVAANRGYAKPAAQAVRGFLDSRGHRANIEGRYDTTGVGVARSPAGDVYVTQIFVGR